MTGTNWQAVAVIIAAMIAAVAAMLGPSLAVIVKARTDQPKETPNSKSPSSLEPRITVSVKRLAVVVLVLGLVFNVLLFLLFWFSRSTPLTFGDVFGIVLAVVGLHFHPLSFLITRLGVAASQK
jgi:formate hydrogenlyase subunit 3/multisubunit Na+/H+ antiporter MnhD subunit